MTLVYGCKRTLHLMHMVGACSSGCRCCGWPNMTKKNTEILRAELSKETVFSKLFSIIRFPSLAESRVADVKHFPYGTAALHFLGILTCWYVEICQDIFLGCCYYISLLEWNQMEHTGVLCLGMIIQAGPAAVFLITAVYMYFSLSQRKPPRDRNFWTLTVALAKASS